MDELKFHLWIIFIAAIVGAIIVNLPSGNTYKNQGVLYQCFNPNGERIYAGNDRPSYRGGGDPGNYISPSGEKLYGTCFCMGCIGF